MKHLWAQFTFVIVLFCVNLTYAQSTFTNPLLPSGADPWCIYKDGYYYYTNTTGKNITLWKTANIATLSTSEKKIAWTPPDTGAYSKQLWAPEIHYLWDKWYIYFAADDGRNINHRLYVLENASKDPLKGSWVLKGQLYTPENKWAIDGSVFENKKQLYLIWSGWKGDVNGEQDIYIAKMKNPWTVQGKRTLISEPVYDWEKNGDLNNPNDVPHVNVNEGPQILKHRKKLFLIYSASGCWTDNYSLGMLTANKNSDLTNASSWVKTDHPIFKGSDKNKVYAPGHNSFFKSPDGKENYILYHANSKPSQGCGIHRSPRAQPFTWNKDGSPNFGEPVSEDMKIPVPSETATAKEKIISLPVSDSPQSLSIN